MEFLPGALPSTNQSPALLSFHFVSLYFSELKSHDQGQDSPMTSETFPPVTPVNHAHCDCKASGLTEWVSGLSSSSLQGCIATVPLFTLLPHIVQCKTKHLETKSHVPPQCQHNSLKYNQIAKWP